MLPITLMLSIHKLKYNRLYVFEILMVTFIFFHLMTALNFNYPESSIRFIILYIILFMFYFTLRGLIINIRIENLELIISKAGLVGIISSLSYYLIGVYASGMEYIGNEINFYGLLLDRSTPRLTGTVSGDPNIFVFYVTLYFFFTLTNLHSRMNKIGFLLATVAIILSLSRGAYISIIVGIVVFLLVSRNRKTKLKIIFIAAILFVIILKYQDNFNIINYITQRFNEIAQDGGSGRFTIWMNAINTFKENPMGIGINSTIPYNLEHFSKAMYVHNSFLEVLLETGIIGFVIYLSLWVAMFYCSYKLIYMNKRTVYIFITLISMFIQLNSLSIFYNEALYFAILLLYRYCHEYYYIKR